MGVVEGTGEDDETEDRRLVTDRLGGHRADADDRHGGRRRRRGVTCEEVERQPIPDLELGACGRRLVDEHLIGPRRVGQAAGAHHGTFEREGVVGGGEQPPCVGWVDAVEDSEEAGVDLLARDPRDGVERLLGLLERPAVGDGGIQRVRSDEDALVCRRRPARRSEAGETDAEPETEEQPGRRHTAPPSGQPPARDLRDGAHQPPLRP